VQVAFVMRLAHAQRGPNARDGRASGRPACATALLSAVPSRPAAPSLAESRTRPPAPTGTGDVDPAGAAGARPDG